MTTSIPLIYVAGPFSGPTPWDVAENVRAAERVGLAVAYCGGMPIIPHANTHLFDGQLTYEFWLDGTREMLRRCDGAVFLSSWRASSGARREMADCIERQQPTIIVGRDVARDDERLRSFIVRLSRR